MSDKFQTVPPSYCVGCETKILAIMDFYPSAANPAAGAFIRNQLLLMQEAGGRLGLLVGRSRVPWLELINPNYRAIPQNQELNDHYELGIQYVPITHLPTNRLFEHCGVMMYNAIVDRVNKWHRRVGFDVIFANGLMPSGYAAVRLGRELKLPVAVYAIGSDFNVWPYYSSRAMSLTAWTLRQADLILSVSHTSAGQISKLHKPRRLEVVYRGCDLARFRTGAKDGGYIRERLSIPANSDVILFVGRLIKGKGIRELTQAFEGLLSRCPNLHLLLVGDGSMRTFVQQWALQTTIREHVSIAGIVDSDQIPRYLAASDVLVLPSYREGMPNSVVEAMAAGKCVISTAVGGVPEIIRHKENGMLIEPEDVTSLTDTLWDVLNDKKLRVKLGLAARQTAEELLDSGKNAQTIVKLFNEIIETTV